MSSMNWRNFHICWITFQAIFTLVGPYPENVQQFYPNGANIPRLHPSKNPNCVSRWSAYNDIYNYPQFKYKRRIPEETSTSESPIQIRATLASCTGSSANTKQYENPEVQADAKECRQKVTITVQINNVGKMSTQERFLIVDNILDPVTKRKVRLLNPYVIKIRQEAILQLYGLKFQGVVNAEAREEVINKNRPNFTGCNDGLQNPTCGQTLLRGEPIPYSQGFCCSCEDEEEQVRRRQGIPNEFPENSRSDGGPNCKDSANKPCNRLAPQAAYVNILDNSQRPGGAGVEQLYSRTTHSWKTTGSYARDDRLTLASARRERERESRDEKLMDRESSPSPASTMSSGKELHREEKRQTNEDVLSSNGHVSIVHASAENKRNVSEQRLTGLTNSQEHLASVTFGLPGKEETDREVASSSTGASRARKAYVTDETSPIPGTVLFADTTRESKMKTDAGSTAERVSPESGLARPEDREPVSGIEQADGTKGMETIHVARKSGESDSGKNGRAHDRPTIGNGAGINLQPWNLIADPEELRNEVDAFKKMKSFKGGSFSDNKPAKFSKFHNSMKYETHSEDRINRATARGARVGSSSSVSTSGHGRNYIERVTLSGSEGRVRSGRRNIGPGNGRVERGKKDSFEDSQSVSRKKSSTNSGKEVPSCAGQDSLKETTVTRPNAILRSSIADPRDGELHKLDRAVISKLLRDSTFDIAGNGSRLLSRDLMLPGSSGRNELSMVGKSGSRFVADFVNGSVAKLENISASTSIPKQNNSMGIALKHSKYKVRHLKSRDSKKELEDNRIIYKRRNEFSNTDSKHKSKYHFKNAYSPSYAKISSRQSPGSLYGRDKTNSRPNRNRKRNIKVSIEAHPEVNSSKGEQTDLSRPSNSEPRTTVSANIPNPDEGRYKDQYAASEPASHPYYVHSDEKVGRARRENSGARNAGQPGTQISSEDNASRTKSYSAYETRESMSVNDFDENVKSTFSNPLCAPSADSPSASSLAAETVDDPFYSSRNGLRSSTANRRTQEKFKRIGTQLAEAESDVDRTNSSNAARVDAVEGKFATMSAKIRNEDVLGSKRERDQITQFSDAEFRAELPISAVEENRKPNKSNVNKSGTIEINTKNIRHSSTTAQMQTVAECTETEKTVIMADQLKIVPIPSALSPVQAVGRGEKQGKLANASESRAKLRKQTELGTVGLVLATRPGIDYFATVKKAPEERAMITGIETASAPIELTGEDRKKRSRHSDRNTSFATTISDLRISEESSKRPFALRTNMLAAAAAPGRRAPLSKKHSPTLPFRSYSQKRLHDISRARHGQRIRSHLPTAFLPDLKGASDMGLSPKQKTAEQSPFEAGLAPGLPTDYRPTEKNAIGAIGTSTEERLGSESSSEITSDDVSRTEVESTTESTSWQTTRITDQNFRPFARPATPFVPGRAKIVLSVDELTFEEDEVDSSGESSSTVSVTFPVRESSGPTSYPRIRSKFTVDSTQSKFEPGAESMSDKSSSGKIVVRSSVRWPDALRITSPSAWTTVSGKLARMRKFGGNSSELRKLSKVDHETTRWGGSLLGRSSFVERARSEAPREDNFYPDYRMSSNKYGTNNTPEEIFSATDVSDGAMEKFRGSDGNAEHSRSNGDKVGSGGMAKLAEPLKSAELRDENMSGPNNVERYLERIRQTEDSTKGLLLGHASAPSPDKPKGTGNTCLTKNRTGIESNYSAAGERSRVRKRNDNDYVSDNYRIDARDELATEELPVLMEADDNNDRPWSTTAGASDALKNILFNLSSTTDDSPFNFPPLAEFNADLSPRPIDEINFALENPNAFLRKYNLSREMKLALARELRRSDAFANFFDPPEDTADSAADGSKINGEADAGNGDVFASFSVTFPTARQIGYRHRLPAATYSLYDATDTTFALNPTVPTFHPDDYPNFNRPPSNEYGPIRRMKRKALGAEKMATADHRAHGNASRDSGAAAEGDQRRSSAPESNRTSHRSDEATKFAEITVPFRQSEKKISPGKLYYDGSRAVSRLSADKLRRNIDSPNLRRGNEGKTIKEEEEEGVARGVRSNDAFLATKNFADRILLACTGKFDNRQKDSARISQCRGSGVRPANDVLKEKNGVSLSAPDKSSAIYDAGVGKREFERTANESADDDDSGPDSRKVRGNRVRDNSMSEFEYSLSGRSFDPSSSFAGEDEEGNLVFTARKLRCLTDLSDRNAEKLGSDRLIDHREEDAPELPGNDYGGYIDLLTSKKARDSGNEGEYLDDGINNFNIVRELKGNVRRLLSIEMNLSQPPHPAGQSIFKRSAHKRKLLTQSALFTENENIDRIRNPLQNNYRGSRYRRQRSIENTVASKYLKPGRARVINRQDSFVAASDDDVDRMLQGSDGSFAKKIDKSSNSPEIGLLSNFKNVADELDGTSAFNELSSEKRFHSAIGYNPTPDNKGTDVRIGGDADVESGAETAVRRNLLETGDIKSAIDSRTKPSHVERSPNRSMNPQENTVVNSECGESGLDSIGMRPISDENQLNKSPAGYSMDSRSDTHKMSNDISKEMPANGVPGARLFSHVFNIESVPDALAHSADTIANKAGAVARVSHNIHARNSYRRERKDVELSMNPIEKLSIHGSKDVRSARESGRTGSSNDLAKHERRLMARRRKKISSKKRKSYRTTTPPPAKYPKIFDNSRLISNLQGKPESHLQNPSDSDLRSNEIDRSSTNASYSGNSEMVPLLSIKIDSPSADAVGTMKNLTANENSPMESSNYRDSGTGKCYKMTTVLQRMNTLLMTTSQRSIQDEQASTVNQLNTEITASEQLNSINPAEFGSDLSDVTNSLDSDIENDEENATDSPNGATTFSNQSCVTRNEEIRKKNMLAIKDFIKRLHTIMTNDASENSLPKVDELSIHINRFVIKPVNDAGSTEEDCGCCTTEKVIVMGEGTNHHTHENETGNDDLQSGVRKLSKNSQTDVDIQSGDTKREKEKLVPSKDNDRSIPFEALFGSPVYASSLLDTVKGGFGENPSAAVNSFPKESAHASTLLRSDYHPGGREKDKSFLFHVSEDSHSKSAVNVTDNGMQRTLELGKDQKSSEEASDSQNSSGESLSEASPENDSSSEYRLADLARSSIGTRTENEKLYSQSSASTEREIMENDASKCNSRSEDSLPKPGERMKILEWQADNINLSADPAKGVDRLASGHLGSRKEVEGFDKQRRRSTDDYKTGSLQGKANYPVNTYDLGMQGRSPGNGITCQDIRGAEHSQTELEDRTSMKLKTGIENDAAYRGGVIKKREKRRRKKKKKKKKRRRKKKKKKGRVRNAEYTEKWRRTSRHLLAVSEERGIPLTSTLNEDEDRLASGYLFEEYEELSGRYAGRAGNRGWEASKRSKRRPRIHRQIEADGAQIRGGQDCTDRKHPANVSLSDYSKSAHCLRFSNLWYSVYELEKPITEHVIYLELYEKRTLPNGSTYWNDLTGGSIVRLGTFNTHHADDEGTITFAYTDMNTKHRNRERYLDPAKDRLLIPSTVASGSGFKNQGSSGEYLVVEAEAINENGNECDKAGVGFAAFVGQANRCGRVRGTCLKNQPLAYWRHDMEARMAGQPGCYFLSNFASVPTDPIKYNVSGSGSREFLGLEYDSPHVSTIDIEVRADNNAAVKAGTLGRINEVYVDNTDLERTVVIAIIKNTGPTSSSYQLQTADCPKGLPITWTKAKSPVQIITPQLRSRMTIDIPGRISTGEFYCSLQLVNHRGEAVATRRIKIRKMDRCHCVWHCECTCVGSDSGQGCQPMSLEHYHAAGFRGPVPVLSSNSFILSGTVRDVLLLSALLALVLLAMGMIKWFIGLFVPAVGRWGLDAILSTHGMNKYLEQELKCRCTVTDKSGSSVRPDRREKTERICSRKMEFLLNLIFFMVYPIVKCCSCAKNLCRSKKQRQCSCSKRPKTSQTEQNGDRKFICMRTYKDYRDSKTEAEDMKYVMKELRKSQESLRDYMKYEQRNYYCRRKSSPRR